MALPNNAKIKDIITELQDMQMINGKAEVTNIIGSPVTSSDNPAQIVTKVLATKTKMANHLTSKGVNASNSESVDSLATKIGNITPATMGAVKRKDGFTTSVTHTSTLGKITVTGLGFQPSLVMARTLNYNDLECIFSRVRIGSNIIYKEGYISNGFIGVTGSSMGLDGFTLIVNNRNSEYYWIAYE